jgi:hypothetical protein
MDAMITNGGIELYYCNAFFDTCIGPCAGTMGIAARVNDSTFNTIANSATLLQHINDSNYIVYAPNLSVNGLELYYTRLMKGTFNTENCVSVRATVTDTFSSPIVLHADLPNLPEAPTVNANADLMYYHKKLNGTFAIFLRYRIPTSIEEPSAESAFTLYPNPACNEITIAQPISPGAVVRIFNLNGELVSECPAKSKMDVSSLTDGLYIIQFIHEGEISQTSFSICR